MVEVLHLAAVFPATVGLCCAVGDRRSRARSVAAAATMLLAMVAMAAGSPGVPSVVWAGVLVALGIATAIGLRHGADATAPLHARRMQLHRAFGLVLGAALLLVGAHPATELESGHPGHSGGMLLAATLAGSAGYLVFTVWLVAASVRRRAPIVGIVESSAMGLMTMLMALVPLVG
jgi:hypothetical protein